MISSATAKSISLVERKQASLLGLFIGDALAAPVHWYYDVNNIKKVYGAITGFTKTLDEMEGGYMGKISMSGGGHANYEGQVIGKIILQGKEKYWAPVESNKYSYHAGLEAGETTLEGSIARLLIRTINSNGGVFDYESFQNEYVKFMTTPGTHNDAFASGHHRQFFSNFAGGIPVSECGETVDKVSDQMDALTFPTPIIISLLTEEGANEKLHEVANSVNKIFRKSETVSKWIDLYTDMLASVLTGQKTLKEVALEAGEKISFDVKASVDEANEKSGPVDFNTYLGGDGSDPMASCPFDKSFPALLHFTYRYADAGFKTALLASANGGGENVARGSALGALFGAQYGLQGIPEELRSLYNRAEIEAEISSLTHAPLVDAQKSEL